MLEKEYSSKLLLLANKAAEKKSRKIAALVLGEEPTKAWGEEDVRNRWDLLLFGPWVSQVLMCYSTLGRAYTELINSFSESAQDHVNLADGLDAQVVNVLKLTEKRHEEAKKKVPALGITIFPASHVGHPSQQMKAFQKLLSDRDRAYGDRIKVSQSSSNGIVYIVPSSIIIRASRWYSTCPPDTDAGN